MLTIMKEVLFKLLRSMSYILVRQVWRNKPVNIFCKKSPCSPPAYSEFLRRIQSFVAAVLLLLSSMRYGADFSRTQSCQTVCM